VITAPYAMMKNLFADVFKLSVPLDHLRFHISFQDAKNILLLRPKKVIEGDICVLERFSKVADLIQKRTGLQIGNRRKYALLGQAVMKQDFYVLQTPLLAMFIHPANTMDWILVKHIADVLSERFCLDFESNDELQNMKGFDHDGEDPDDGEDPLEWILDEVEEIEI
jgi:hypothetical protein